MRIAIDCDLKTSYCVSDSGWSGRGLTPIAAVVDGLSAPAPLAGATFLFEIASPVSFNRSPGSDASVYHLARWAIWNVTWAVRMRAWVGKNTFLVAPSNVWTKGHPEKTRHMIAGARLGKKDLRECEAMLFFHNLHPESWVNLSDYLRNL